MNLFASGEPQSVPAKLNLSFDKFKYKPRIETDSVRISKRSLFALLRRAGCRRISTHVIDAIRNVLKAFLKQTIGYSMRICANSRRKTVSMLDVLYALKLSNIRYYA